MGKRYQSKASVLIRTAAASIYGAFVQPKVLSRFWLKESSGPLEEGVPVKWDFMVPGASETTTAQTLRPAEVIIFRWSDGVLVKIEITRKSPRLSVVHVSAGPFSSSSKAVNATEGFSIVLCDLKILLESGNSPGLVKSKAKLIVMS